VINLSAQLSAEIYHVANHAVLLQSQLVKNTSYYKLNNCFGVLKFKNLH